MTASLNVDAYMRHNSARPERDVEKVSAYYLQIEGLLDRVERAVTHYQVLGLMRSATREDIRTAYRDIVSLLHPSFHGLHDCIPEETVARINKAMEKISDAFATLINLGKRIEYDNSLFTRATCPLPLTLPGSNASAATSPDSSELPAPSIAGQQVIDTTNNPSQFPPRTKAETKTTAENRRHRERFDLILPVRITGCDAAEGKWREVAQTINVSQSGVAVSMRHRVRSGMVLHLSLPLPVRLRRHGHDEPNYKVYALVRHIERGKDGMRTVGLEFMGENPPEGYLTKPWARFRAPSWTGGERRREPRVSLSKTAQVEFLDETMRSIAQIQATVENVSRSGARLCIEKVSFDFEMVRVSSSNPEFESLAEVRDRYFGTDGLERICLRFVGKKWPL
ncbi:MAG TPA: PilZ domain-containing protein [Blastocatellia bacterium]|nr:PilZ domain-containing protein [Blastocatellia bacterium]